MDQPHTKGSNRKKKTDNTGNNYISTNNDGAMYGSVPNLSEHPM